MTIVAYAIAILLPLLFLYLIYVQDLYGQGKFRHVLLSFGWGLAAFGGAYGVLRVAGGLLENHYRAAGISTYRVPAMAYITVVVWVAPIVEELLKSLVLVFLGRRMTYFVDGAIYGFASGIAFSILENTAVYMPEAGQGAGWLALLRTLSACLMHGAASALVGTAIGRFRYGRGGRRMLSMVGGWAAAISLHMLFNRLGTADPGLGVMLGGLGIGIGGAVLIILFIRGGLTEEKRWIEETLGLGAGVTGVTKQEITRIQQYDQIDDLLEPIVERFGEEKADQVEEFLLKQAHMGIKQKARAMSQDPRDQEKLDQETTLLREEMEVIRRQVGVYCMIYVRALFPEDAPILWSALQQMVEDQGPADPTAGLWGRLGQQMGEKIAPPEDGV